ncbi:hypothetical protein G6F55_014246 [Rhizopus delemar]|nr:hypothetical protein G6F55_014246 [Rhizopus delemar]
MSAARWPSFCHGCADRACPLDDMPRHPYRRHIGLLTWLRLRTGRSHVAPDRGCPCRADCRRPAHRCARRCGSAATNLRCLLSWRVGRALPGVEHSGRTPDPPGLCGFHH